MKRYAKQLSMNERDLGLRGNYPLNSLELPRLSVFFSLFCVSIHFWIGVA